MKRRSRHASLFTSILLLGACQQIIGLSDYESVDEEEEGGGGGKGGTTGGSLGGGTGGKAGKGGSAGGSVGGTSGRGGGSAGKGGTGGKGGTTGGTGQSGEGGAADGGTGGSTGGRGGTAGKGGSAGSGGSSGSGGKGACVELTLQGVVGMSVGEPDPGFRSTVFDVAIQQQLVGGAEDFVGFQFYAGDNFDGQSTGTFELGTGIDDNYETCGRCVLVERDAPDIGSAGNTRFFATSGTIDIDDASEQMDGRPSLTISDVTLVEVEVDPDTFESTPVDGGDCYHITSYSMELPTSAWNCPVLSWGDNICDCGCDAPDLECVTTTISSCESCNSAGSCAQDCTGIAFGDNSQCSGNNPTWNCPVSTYGDGFCNCGCGSTDPECDTDYVGACHSCNDPGSCDGSTDCSTIALEDNSTCAAGNQGWTCDPTYYGKDDGCDCGCGLVEPDCSPPVDVGNECYCGTGSCASSSACTEIDPNDVGQCL